MKIFLETSILSDVSLLHLIEELLQKSSYDELYISSLTHFEILLGYRSAKRSTLNYDELLKSLKIEVVPLSRTDSEEAARNNPPKRDFIDSLIAATVSRYGAVLWTKDSDFLKFLSRDNLRLIK